MTPGQYRLHRLSTMRAAMRASARFLSLDECILPFISVSFLEDDEAPVHREHKGAAQDG